MIIIVNALLKANYFYICSVPDAIWFVKVFLHERRGENLWTEWMIICMNDDYSVVEMMSMAMEKIRRNGSGSRNSSGKQQIMLDSNSRTAVKGLNCPGGWTETHIDMGRVDRRTHT